MGEDKNLLLALTLENAELRRQLAAAQDRLVEIAIDAGHLHARISALQVDLAEARSEREAWRAEARRLGAAAPRSA